MNTTEKKWPQSDVLFQPSKPTTTRADGNQRNERIGLVRQWILTQFRTLHGRHTARHLVTAFICVSMPIKDEITCGDGCVCVGENTSVIKDEWCWNNDHNNNKHFTRQSCLQTFKHWIGQAVQVNSKHVRRKINTIKHRELNRLEMSVWKCFNVSCKKILFKPEKQLTKCQLCVSQLGRSVCAV